MNLTSENQFVLEKNTYSLHIKREDVLHPTVSGNKFRKLRYNLAFAKANNHHTILTFGGAYSNHIAATASAGKLEGFKSIGMIRGEELGDNLAKTLSENPTLAFAQNCGMKFHFVSREQYRDKNSVMFLKNIAERFNNPYIIPEGGTNDLAVRGCEEILTSDDTTFDYICCAAGTGGTVSGIINSLQPHQKVLVFPALKGKWMSDEIRKYSRNEQWELITDFHFGGYARVTEDLVHFINNFNEEYGIPLDPVYTGKMIYGISQLINDRFFPENSRILAIHTGGLQGVAGMNLQLARKGLPLIAT